MAAGTMPMEVIRILYYVLKPLMPRSKTNARMPAQDLERKRDKFMAFFKTLKGRPSELACIISLMPKLLANLSVASVSAESIELKGPRIIEELTGLLTLLTLCILFSKKPFPELLKSAGSLEVLYWNPKAEFLKPAFAIISDKNLKCIIVLIRGTQSNEDVVTDLWAAPIAFEHSVVNGGGTRNLVKDYAHHGMVAAARWIAHHAELRNQLNAHPGYSVKIVGHSLGGGTAALLTCILRGKKELSSNSITCVTFGPPACMTRDLAESGKHFITTVINGSDFVPALSTASIAKLHSDITSSPWFNDALNQGKRENFKNAFYLGKSLLRPVSNSTQSSVEDITEAKLWEEVIRDLQSTEDDEAVVEAQPDAAKNKQASSSSGATTKIHQFYPPGRIVHIVEEEHDVHRIYETPRERYSKLPLSRTMVRDHYLSEYKRMMDLVINQGTKK